MKTMHNLIRKTAAGVLAAAALTAALPSLSASAAIEYQLRGYRGDLNGDLAVNREDVSILTQHLLGTAPLTDPSVMEFADLDGNGRLNAVDLTLLKRILLTGAEPEGLYDEIEVPDPPVEDKLISPPIAAVNPTLPSTGTNQILMFAVDSPDCPFTEGYTTEQIWNMSFGPEDPSDSSYPLESICAYYERASYGRLHMEGDVFRYTTKNNLDAYFEKTDALLEEILQAFDNEIDYTKYDVNGDKTMDTVILALPEGAKDHDANGDGNEDWWPCSGGYYGRKRFDGVIGGNLIMGRWSLNDRQGFNSTWVHELGHAMGLPDYYKYTNTQNGYYGLNGDAGWEMMDDAYGDMSAFSKLMYGWYTESEVKIYTGGTQTFELLSSQEAPNCIVIPRGDLNDFHSEYFIIEFAEHTKNNAIPWRFGSGIRILHCTAELWNGYWGPELKWNNYGQMYNDSNEKQRVIRLVNEKEGGSFFKTGSTVNGNISGFHWYDDNGDQTVDPGLTVTIGALTDGKYTVTISQN